MNKDDVPKLREEKQLDEIYTDLDATTLIPLIVDSSGIGLENVNITDKVDAKSPSLNIKQIIFKGKSILEPININPNRTKFKRCTKDTSKPLAESLLAHEQDVVPKNTNNATSPINFDEINTPYYTIFDSNEVTHPSTELVDFLAKISTSLQNFETLYDMDEQDFLYLEYLNQKYGNGKLSEDLFEMLITVLEREWSRLEKKMPLQSSPSSSMSYGYEDNISHAYRIHYDLYGSDDGIYPTTEQACAICDGVNSDNSNAIVFCDGCNIAVHQECYGIVFIPEGQWLCRRCLIYQNRKIKCVFCPSYTGAFKQTDVGTWAHVLCALWLPELYFANLNYMEPIEGFENIPKSRWRLICYICNQRGGACIQCCNKNCFRSYHITCAKRAGLYMKFNGVSISGMAINQFAPGHSPKTFCDKHVPNTASANFTSGLVKAKRYFKYLKEDEDKYSDSQPIEQIDMLDQKDTETNLNKVKKNIWQTTKGTPIAPHYFAIIIQKILYFCKIPNTPSLSYDICKYWSMKREFKSGAPLVRIYDSSAFNTLDVDELNDRIEFSDVLLRDLNKLKKLVDLVDKRTQIEEGLSNSKSIIDTIVKNPMRWKLRNLVIIKLINFSDMKILISEKKNDAELAKMITHLNMNEFDNESDVKMAVNNIFDYLAASSSKSNRYLINLENSKAYFNELLSSIKEVEIQKNLERDFEIDGDNLNNIVERKWKGRLYLKEFGISDVEELGSKEMRYLNYLLRAKPKKKSVSI